MYIIIKDNESSKSVYVWVNYNNVFVAAGRAGWLKYRQAGSQQLRTLSTVTENQLLNV